MNRSDAGPIAARVVQLDDQIGGRRLGADVETNTDLPPQVQVAWPAATGPPTGDASQTITGAGSSTTNHRNRPRPAVSKHGGQHGVTRQHGAHRRLESRPIQAP